MSLHSCILIFYHFFEFCSVHILTRPQSKALNWKTKTPKVKLHLSSCCRPTLEYFYNGKFKHFLFLSCVVLECVTRAQHSIISCNYIRLRNTSLHIPKRICILPTDLLCVVHCSKRAWFRLLLLLDSLWKLMPSNRVQSKQHAPLFKIYFYKRLVLAPSFDKLHVKNRICQIQGSTNWCLR